MKYHSYWGSGCFLGIMRVVNKLKIFSLSLIVCATLLNFITHGNAFSFNSGSFHTKKSASNYDKHVMHTGFQIVPTAASVGNPSSSHLLQMCIDRNVNEELQDLGRFQGEKSDRDSRWVTDPTGVVPMSIQPFTRPALITFDAMDTLIEPSQSVGRWYREALNAVGDMRLRLPRPGLFTAAFNKVFADMCKSDPCFGAKSGTSSRDWWYQVVKKTFQTTENLHTQIDEEELESIMPELFELVYEEIFNTEEGWIVKSDAVYTLKKLTEWRDMGGGPKLGIISNFDDRLHSILGQLELAESFDFILTSYESACEKPDRGMFDEALKRAQCSDPSLAYHVGNSIDIDAVGAITAGWTPLVYNEWFDEQFPDWNEINTIEDAAEGAAKQQEFYQWGRKDTSNGLEWCELWGLDDVLTLFGFPEDNEKPVKTTYIRNFRSDE